MKHMKLVKQWAKDNDINLNSVSFYQGLDNGACVEAHDTEFGYCDITNAECSIARCTAALHSGAVIEFDASEHLIGGALGKLAGVF